MTVGADWLSMEITDWLRWIHAKRRIEGCRCAEAADEIERLQAAKRDALKVADERSKQNCDLWAENERLRAALDRYGRHDDGCEEEPWHGKGPRYCSCGFLEAYRADQAADTTNGER